MQSVTEYLEQLLKLTQKNLDILKGINDAFYTKSNHLDVNVDDVNYTIPSFMSLESQINNLSENFYNLVHAPETGEAYFDFNGNTRAIEVRGYLATPNKIQLNTVDNFYSKYNNIFDQLTTPNMFINFELNDLPEDITSVVVKKIEPINKDLKKFFNEHLKASTKINNEIPDFDLKSEKVKLQKIDEVIIPLPSIQYKYSDLNSVLLTYKKGVDYNEYEEIIKLPIRTNIGYGLYAVSKIEKNEIQDSLDLYYTLKIRTNNLSDEYMKSLQFNKFDGILTENLQEGDELTSYDGKTKLKILGVNHSSNSIKVIIENGEYLNIEGCGDDIEENNISEVSKLRFFRQSNETLNRKISVNLINGNYLYIVISALNERMNIRSPWGTGLMLNPMRLTNGDKTNDIFYGNYLYDFYKKNVKNIGETLRELITISYNNITSIAESEFNNITKIKPDVKNYMHLNVVQINTHLSENDIVKKIRQLNSDKNKEITEKEKLDEQIESKELELSKISFDDVTGIRAGLVKTLNEYKTSRINKIKNISELITLINDIVKNSELPIEDAKYRIRGWFDYDKFAKNHSIDPNHVIGIEVIYKYRNPKLQQGHAMVMNDGFLFSGWNKLPVYIRTKYPIYNGGYTFKLESDNKNIDLPSFNQLDIPITAGEIVDIKLKVIYDYGYPFINTTSDWSNLYPIDFPEELNYNKEKILNIIKQNSEDSEIYKFNQLLDSNGVPEHIADKLNDQNIIYFHKPEHIASGFYTNESRIVSLKDKLLELTNNVNQLLSEVNGDPSKNLNVMLNIGKNFYSLTPFHVNQITVEPYCNFSKENIPQGPYEFNNNIASVTMYVTINNLNSTLNTVLIPTANGSIMKIDGGLNINNPVKVYSLFPGDRDTKLYDIKYNRFPPKDYTSINNKEYGVWLKTLTPMTTQWTYTPPENMPDYHYPEETPSTYKTVNNSEIVFNAANNDFFKTLQTANQFITFRLNNVTNGLIYYGENINNDIWNKNDLLPLDKNIELPTGKNGAAFYPLIKNEDSLKMSGGSPYSYELLSINNNLSIPLKFEYNLSKTSGNEALPDQVFKSISKTIVFDIRTSLYTDPISYIIRITANNKNIDLNNISSQNVVIGDIEYNTTVE